MFSTWLATLNGAGGPVFVVLNGGGIVGAVASPTTGFGSCSWLDSIVELLKLASVLLPLPMSSISVTLLSASL